MVAKKIIFSGQVQGVGFRYTCHKIAQKYMVTGYVQNKSDGSVELKVEGSQDEILSFLNAIETKMSGNITSITSQESDSLNRKTFEILI